MAYASKDYRMPWHRQTETSISVPMRILIKTINSITFDPQTECWNYQTDKTSPDAKGHVAVSWRDKQGYHNVGLHRIALIRHTDEPAPPGKLALHSCGNERCLAGYHLYWGDDKQNAADLKRHRAERAARAKAGRRCEAA